MKWELSNRVQSLPTYVFSQINLWKKELEAKGVDLVSLAIGDPDSPTPSILVEQLIEASRKFENHVYSPYEGTQTFRKSVADYMAKRFNVSVDFQNEVIALIGSKEGIAHFPQAFCNPGDRCLYPDPGYPIFQTGILLAGGIAVPISHREENGFQPDAHEFEQLLIEHEPKIAVLNFPSNPTTAIISKAGLSTIVQLAKKHHCILAFDNAYCEIYENENTRPISIFEIDGAKDVAIEFHSLSKTFHMTGWRIGFAVGNAQLIQALLRVKTNIDSGPLLSVQQVGAYALDNSNLLSPAVRKLYSDRKKVAKSMLRDCGIDFFDSDASFFIWAKVPYQMKSIEFTKSLMEKQGLIVTPGSGFGLQGESYFRLALTVKEERLKIALERLKKFMNQ